MDPLIITSNDIANHLIQAMVSFTGAMSHHRLIVSAQPVGNLYQSLDDPNLVWLALPSSDEDTPMAIGSQ